MEKLIVLRKLIRKKISRFHFLEKLLVLIYEYLNYFLYRKNKKVYLNENVSLDKVGKINNFWGYYDKSPEKNGYHIYHSFQKKDIPRNLDTIDICFGTHKISKTNTWNWQQGSMLTWFNKEEVIHNFYDKTFKSKIINIKTKEVKIIDFPIYSVSKNCKFSISLNFSRLAKLRPDYGYFNEKFHEVEKWDTKDGVFFIDIEKNTKKLIISFEKLIELNYRDEMKSAYHKVNHIDISPNGERFMFIHRWINSEGKKWSRLITADINGENIYILSDDDMVSHCIWKNNHEILGWMRKKEFGDKYYLLEDKTDKFQIIGDGILNEDGHPSFSKDKEWLLTDTYPNKSRMGKVLLYNLKTKKLVKLAEFYSSIKLSVENRCDLHPRFSDTDGYITFDSDFKGTRALYKMEIRKVLKNDSNFKLA